MLKPFRINKFSGAILTASLTALIIFVLFNEHILEANQVSFASGGDGIKSTFSSLYHIKYDSSFWRFEGMNYPFGESVFFTGNQTFLSNLLKLCNESGWKISGYALGIMNLWLLFSYVLCALFLYLILIELKIAPWYAVLGGIIITFLSPQWHRMSGHYNLAYAFVIPAAVYMLIRFYRKPSYIISALFGIFTVIIAGKHIYFIAITGVIWIVYWIFLLFRSNKIYGGSAFLIPHFLIQMIVPVLVYILFSGIYDLSDDRTVYPWGFFQTTTRLASVFLPILMPQGKWIHIGASKTLGYIGFTASIVLISNIVLIFLRWRQEGIGKAFLVSDIFILNILFLSGILTLLISLGLPFTLGFHDLLNHTGPFRQFRAIGRFVIAFYYLVNIFTFWFLWNWYIRSGKSRVALFVLALALTINAFEAGAMIYNKPGAFYHKFTTLNDRENKLPENRWVLNHDWSEYQAIMPIPYYHIGSECYWINGTSPVIEQSYFASLKTGLPLNSVMLSRTSISESLENIDLYFEPYKGYPVLEDYKKGMPILLLRHRNGQLSEGEKALISKSIPIDSNQLLLFYRLNPDSITGNLKEQRLQQAEKIRSLRENPGASNWYLFETFDSLPGGRYSARLTEPRTLLYFDLPDSGSFMVSFWYTGASKDLWPRTRMVIDLLDEGGTSYAYRLTEFFRESVLRDEDKGLIEFMVEARAAGDILVAAYENTFVTNGDLMIDNLLIRKEKEDVLTADGEVWGLNNRYLQNLKR